MSETRFPSSVFRHPSFAGLAVIARSLYPIPSRTRPSKSSAPMVLSLKAWKSRSLPGLPRTEFPLHRFRSKKPCGKPRGFLFSVTLRRSARSAEPRRAAAESPRPNILRGSLRSHLRMTKTCWTTGSAQLYGVACRSSCARTEARGRWVLSSSRSTKGPCWSSSLRSEPC
jgi:hypothetical protein